MAETTSVNPELLLDQVSAIPGDGQPPGRAWLSPSHSVVAGENAIWCPMVDSNHRCASDTHRSGRMQNRTRCVPPDTVPSAAPKRCGSTGTRMTSGATTRRVGPSAAGPESRSIVVMPRRVIRRYSCRCRARGDVVMSTPGVMWPPCWPSPSSQTFCLQWTCAEWTCAAPRRGTPRGSRVPAACSVRPQRVGR